MSIMFLLSLISIMSSFILIKKTEKKIDIFSFIGITAVIIMCYNVFLAYILTFFKIQTTLQNLSIINFAVSIIFTLMIIKKKEIQRYKINKIDILCILIITIGVGIVSYFEFGFPFNIKYETSDPSVHYLTSVEFAKNETLLTNYNDIIYGNMQIRKPASYVNSGLIMMIFSPYMEEIEFYNIFIAFGISVLLETGIVMYNTLVKFSKNNKTRIMACIVSLIYVLGYPFNSLLFGFEYMSLAILIIGAIIEMVYYFENKNFKLIYNIIIFFLLNFGLFFSYYTFVPFVYSGLWIYFCLYSYKQNKKLKNILKKENVIILVITLLIPFALGYIYHMNQDLYKAPFSRSQLLSEESRYLTEGGFAQKGYIYVNFYSNMILFIPITVYVLKKEYKNYNFDFITLFFLVGYIVLLFIGYFLNKVSAYYICKNYYILWLLLIYENFKGLMYMYDKDKHDPYVCITAYIILIIIGLLFTKVQRIEANTNIGENIFKVTDIYAENKTIINETRIIYTKEELEILKYVRENLDYNKEIEILGNKHQLLWGYPLLRYINYEDEYSSKEDFGQMRLLRKLGKIPEKVGNIDYLIYFNKSLYYMYYDKTIDLFKDGEIIYKNNAGGIVKYIKQ